MDDYFEDIEEVNNSFWCGEIEEALGTCEELLYEWDKEWKIPYLKLVCENANRLNFKCVFTGKSFDMILVSKDGKYIFPVHFLHDDLDDDKLKDVVIEIAYANTNYYRDIKKYQSSNNKQVVRSIVIGSKSMKWYKEEFSDFREIFREAHFTTLKTFDLNRIMPEKKEEEVDTGYGRTLWRLAMGLEVDEEELKRATIDVMDMAPQSYLSFVKNTQQVAESLAKQKDFFSMRLNCVFVNDKNIDTYELTKMFASSFFEDINVSKIDFSNLTDKCDLEGKLSDMENSVVLIENMDKNDNRDQLIQDPFKKEEMIESLCNHIIEQSNNLFLLSLSEQGWDRLSAISPTLRICFQNVFHFESVSVDMLVKHFVEEVKAYGLEVSTEALALVVKYFEYMKSYLSTKDFNVGVSTMLAGEARYHYTLRITTSNEDGDNFISKQDLQESIKDEYTEDDQKSLPEIMKKLNDLTGLQSVKESVTSLTNLVKVNRLKGNNNAISLNSIFMGNPGTGKTTLASILGEIYKTIGVLSKGHLVAASRQSIVGQYIGDTEQNMRRLIRQAKGGILFIDEAYSLYKPDSPRDFGTDAINVLVDEMEQIKDTTCVILAGYTNNMEEFLTANPGLASRFPHMINFPDYSSGELLEIFINFMQKESFSMSEDCMTIVSEYFQTLIEEKDMNFGNGRVCRNLFEKLKQIHANRMVRENVEAGDEQLLTFNQDDIERLLNGFEIKPKDVIAASVDHPFIDSSYYIKR
ncbi:AAA family ATPase [Marinifilum sp. D714]|uniref:AAA family ATPase n=1 Tax=Marinifilum sp. D714 TaxID=2937523 RepID=UPI0027BEF345|nr:AAA family ATPase [Marinifilum sp. D714]MDQ2178596.1 AAA family ATPase [Marinifilum sp. D714]